MTDNRDTVLALYKQLLNLYPRPFRDQLGESMTQTFNDLYRERKRQTDSGFVGFLLWTFLETLLSILHEYVLALQERISMSTLATNPRSAAVIGLLLTLPLTLLLLVAVFELEPLNGFLKYLFTDAGGPVSRLVGLLVLVGAFLLLPLAFFIVRAPIVHAMNAGSSLFAHPINLVLAVVILGAITFIVGTFVIDQYPCWIGVPNCD